MACASLSNSAGQAHSIRPSFPHCESHQQSKPADREKTLLQKQPCCGSEEVSAGVPIVSDSSHPSSGKCKVKLSVCPRPKLSEALLGAIKLWRGLLPSLPVSFTNTVASEPAPLKSLVCVTTCTSSKHST